MSKFEATERYLAVLPVRDGDELRDVSFMGPVATMAEAEQIAHELFVDEPDLRTVMIYECIPVKLARLATKVEVEDVPK